MKARYGEDVGDKMKLAWGTEGNASVKKESDIQFLSGGYGARHRFNIVVLKMLDAVLRGEVQEAGEVDDITEQLAALSLSMGGGETKTSAPAKKKKPRKKKPPADSDDEDDTPPPPRERSTRRRRRNRKYDDSLTKEEMDAL